jgi:signal transduction histidine kinase/ActR/RegA family two-component response regulator
MEKKMRVHPFRHISIKRKLTSIIMLTSIVTLLLAVAAFVAIDIATLRDAMVKDVTILTRIVASNSTADLVFSDRESATENLAALSVNPNVVASFIYSSNGDVFASYFRRDRVDKHSFPALRKDGYQFGTDYLTQFRSIILNNKPVGAVCVQYDLGAFQSRILRYGAIVAIVLIGASCVAFLLSSLLQRLISQPLLSLAETANMISRDKNYSVRAEKHGQDEIGVLIDGFNEMVSQVQERDTKLEQYSERLEEQVANRTIELKAANEELRLQIAEKHKIEEELFKTRQLESIGLLAGGIAHDFNNLLTAIIGNISLAKFIAPKGDKIYARLVDAEKASERARDLTQQLLTFSKGGAPIKKVTSIAEVIKDSVGFALRGSKSKYELAMADDLWPVEVDVGQISQVVNNLAINADQAMPDGGVITISTENVILTKDQVTALQPGKYVRISVNDSGTGISRKNLPQIFTPYFTTKQRGSGLGLATSYSIVNKHDGLITVESELGTGTTFHVYLPMSEKELAKVENTARATTIGRGKILVMDDEEQIRVVAGEMLANLGYDVEFANDGAEALASYIRAKEPGESNYDLVIMDLTIPGGMGGEEAVLELLKIDPQAKAIVSSGYAQGPVMADFRNYGFKGVIAKPYGIDELNNVIQKVLTE